MTTLLTEASLSGMSSGDDRQGGTDTAVFGSYLEHFVLPVLRPVQVVVDNVDAHQPVRIRGLAADVGCDLVFLPAYSLDSSRSRRPSAS